MEKKYTTKDIRRFGEPDSRIENHLRESKKGEKDKFYEICHHQYNNCPKNGKSQNNSRD